MIIKLIEKKNDVECYEIKNANCASVQILNYGATIHRLFMPDVNGRFLDVVAGFDDIEEYKNKHPHFNAVIGRVANRIGKAKFVLDGKTYELFKNDNGNHLHGGKFGFDRKFWNVKITEEGLLLSYFSKDGEENYPGNLTVNVLYSLSDNNELSIEYAAKTDKDTYCSLTNHAYFNLSGDFNKTILDHILEIKSDKITSIDSELIPDGEFYDVKDTPLDFNTAKTVGRDILCENKFLTFAGGYDFNYVLNNDNKSYVAKIKSPISGIVLETYTDAPCMQLYTGNFLNGLKGKFVFNKNSAFCLETQGYPNACNILNFPSIRLNSGETYNTKTVYKFSIER